MQRGLNLHNYIISNGVVPFDFDIEKHNFSNSERKKQVIKKMVDGSKQIENKILEELNTVFDDESVTFGEL